VFTDYSIYVTKKDIKQKRLILPAQQAELFANRRLKGWAFTGMTRAQFDEKFAKLKEQFLQDNPNGIVLT